MGAGHSGPHIFDPMMQIDTLKLRDNGFLTDCLRVFIARKMIDMGLVLSGNAMPLQPRGHDEASVLA